MISPSDLESPGQLAALCAAADSLSSMEARVRHTQSETATLARRSLSNLMWAIYQATEGVSTRAAPDLAMPFSPPGNGNGAHEPA